MTGIPQQFIHNLNRLHEHPYSLNKILRDDTATRLNIDRKQYVGCNEWEWEGYKLTIPNDIFDGPTGALVETIEKMIADIKAEQERLEREEEEKWEREQEEERKLNNERNEMEIYERVKARIETR